MEWDRRATVLLLANLDYKIEQFKRNGTPRKKKTLLPKLQEQLRMATVVRAQREIDTHLDTLRKKYGHRQNLRSYDDIYVSGTKCLRNLDRTLRASVQCEITAISDHENLKRSETPRTLSRTLRSGSQNIRIDDLRASRSESSGPIDIASIESPLSGKHGSRQHHGSGNLELTPQINGVALTLPQNPLRDSLSPSMPRDLHQETDNDFEIKVSPAGDTPDFQTPPQTLANDTTRRPIGISFSTFYRLQMQGSSSLDWSKDSLKQEFSEPQVSEWTPEKVRDLFNDAQYFRGQCLSLEKKCQSLQDDRRVLSGVRDSGKGIENALRERIMKQHDHITFLNKQLKIQTSLQHFFEEHELSQNLKWIEKDHKDLTQGLNTTFKGFAFLANIHKKLTAINSTDLDDLKKSAHMLQSTSTISDIHDPRLILQSLAGAAICSWVFDGWLQCFAMVSTPLLAAYQEVLRTCVGEKNLQSIDLAAHQRVADSESFQRAFLPHIAKSLTQRFIDAIRPIVNTELSSDNRKEFENSLESVFFLALNIRTKSIGAQGSLEVIWPKPGSCFNKCSMASQSREIHDIDMDGSEQKPRTIALAVVPGFHVRQRGTGLADYHGCAMQNGEHIEDSDCIFPALVII